ncbi:phenylacetate--CoA ligase family protein [candidate division WS5 bacterium]|uniref:Phenylacetate--CoA ligase family protein n=1 Tax=candidate division WS5 bacterium TaxID=2093353 RepID=A0A419DBI8_9BACT|nr:MAG: phenylacetate--CoA ligase family protein [candidate division WS5 bacterium]
MNNLINKMRNIFYEDIAYPIYQCKYGPAFGNSIIKILKRIEEYQWLAHDEMLAMQKEKLRSLIKHAYLTVPYYHEVMKKKGLSPEDIKSANDLINFPVLTKQIIRENRRRLISANLQKGKYIETATGGSTGEPLNFIRDWNTLIWTEASNLRGRLWAGVRIGDREIDFRFIGTPSLLGTFRTKIINKNSLDALAKENELIRYMDKIRSFKPRSIVAYASNLYRIAVVCNKHQINGIEFPSIFSTGELLYDYQRAFIENQFNGKVFDYYGCNEVGSIAHECEHHHKHISEERFIIEVSDSRGNPANNSFGVMTITDLDNYAMPFIRYQNGDLAETSNDPCQCGRALKIIKSIQGRIQEFLRTSDGNYVPAIFFPCYFKDIKGIDQYQIIQPDLNDIILKIVKNSFFSVQELENVKHFIKQTIGENINITVEEHSHIPLTNSGKNRLIVSHLPMDI